MTDILKDAFNKYKYSLIGFFIGALLIFITIIIPMDLLLARGIQSFSIRCIIYLLIIMAWFVVWYMIKEYYPKNKQNKIRYSRYVWK